MRATALFYLFWFRSYGLSKVHYCMGGCWIWQTLNIVHWFPITPLKMFKVVHTSSYNRTLQIIRWGELGQMGQIGTDRANWDWQGDLGHPGLSGVKEAFVFLRDWAKYPYSPHLSQFTPSVPIHSLCPNPTQLIVGQDIVFIFHVRFYYMEECTEYSLLRIICDYGLESPSYS